jgi:hypothetical protein
MENPTMDELSLTEMMRMTKTLSPTDSIVRVNGNLSSDIAGTLTQEFMPAWGFTAAAVVLFLIGFFGFFLNLVVIIVMCKDNQVSFGESFCLLFSTFFFD